MPFDLGYFRELTKDVPDDAEWAGSSSLDEDGPYFGIPEIEVVMRDDGSYVLLIRFNDEKPDKVL